MPINATFTADTRPLARGMQDAAREIAKVTKATGDATRSLKGVGSQFDGTRIEGQALRVAEAVRRIGGVAKLTDAEMARVSRTVQEATQKFERMGQAAPPQIQRLSKELQQVQKSASGVSQALSSFAGGLGIGVGAGAGFAALTALGAGLKDIVAEGAKLGPIRQGFEQMQGGAAQASETLTRMRAATRGLADDLTLMTAANRGALLGLTDMGIDMAELASIATTLGRAVGQDAAKSTDDLTVALARQSPMILDNLGIKLNLTEANERYAASLGKTADELTDEEKKLAFATTAMEAAREKAAALGGAQLTVAEQTQAATVAIRGILTELAELANQSSILVVPMTRLAEVLQVIRNAGVGSTVRVGISSAVDTAKGVLDSIPGARLTPLGSLADMWLTQVNRNLGASGQDVSNVLRGTAALDSMRSIGAQIAREATERAKNATAIRTETQAGQGRAAALQRERAEAERLERVWQRMLRPQVGVNSLLGTSSIGGISGAIAPGFGAVPGLPTPFAPTLGINQFDPVFKQFGVAGAQIVNMSAGLTAATRATTDWRRELQGVGQAFANLAQVAGPALDGITRGLGTILTAGQAGGELAAALGLTREDGRLTRGGRALAGGMAGLSAGLALGGLTGNRGVGFFSGAGAGAASGALSGGGLGAGVGLLVGGLSGLFAANQTRRQQMAQMEAMRQQIIAQYGTLERLQEEAQRAGYSVEFFMSRFNSSNPATFAETIATLTARLQEQQVAADELGRSLESVAAQQGVLSAQQIAQIRNTDPRGPGAEAVVQFAAGQRQQSQQGILRAAAALARASSLTDEELEALTDGVKDSEERQRRIEQALRDKASAVWRDLGAGVQATASAIFVAINDAVASGERLVDVLADMAPAISTVKDLFERSGQALGAGFAQIQSYQDIASGEQTGPALELATGLGQALAGFANTGLLSPELFGELATGIGAAYKQMENFGKGGLDAARLMQPALQNLWQTIQDNPGLEDQLDDDTRALLDFASKSGLIGEKFRPAVDRMIDALDKLIKKFDEYLARLSKAQDATIPAPAVGELPSGPGTPGGGSGGHGGEYFAHGSGGLRDFGRGTLAVLHNREAVLTEGQYTALRAMAQAQLRPSSVGVSGPIRIEVTSVMDSRKVGRGVAEVSPTINRLYAGGA